MRKWDHLNKRLGQSFSKRLINLEVTHRNLALFFKLVRLQFFHHLVLVVDIVSPSVALVICMLLGSWVISHLYVIGLEPSKYLPIHNRCSIIDFLLNVSRSQLYKLQYPINIYCLIVSLYLRRSRYFRSHRRWTRHRCGATRT